MQSIPNRMVVYAKDVMNITGRRERAARKLLAQVRKTFNKQKGDFVTIEEFCRVTGFKEEKVASFLV